MLNEHGWEPSKWTGLNRLEKALVIASISVKVELEQKEAKKAERNARK